MTKCTGCGSLLVVMDVVEETYWRICKSCTYYMLTVWYNIHKIHSRVHFFSRYFFKHLLIIFFWCEKSLSFFSLDYTNVIIKSYILSRWMISCMVRHTRSHLEVCLFNQSSSPWIHQSQRFRNRPHQFPQSFRQDLRLWEYRQFHGESA